MSVVSIISIVGGALIGLAVLLVVVMFARVMANIRKPIRVAATATARCVARDVPLVESGPPTPAMDVYAPEEPDGRPPLLLLVPGDGPEFLIGKAKTWTMFRDYANHAASRGYAAAVMNHRSSRNFKDCAGMADDVEHALQTLRGRADEWGFDPDRIVVWTFSGSTGPILSRFIVQRPAGVVAALSHYGFLDLTKYSIKVPADVVEEYSLPAVLARGVEIPFPVLLLHCGRDRKMMTASFDRVAAQIEEHGLPITTHVYANGRHGFEVLETPEEVRTEIDRSFAFVEEALRGTRSGASVAS